MSVAFEYEYPSEVEAQRAPGSVHRVPGHRAGPVALVDESIAIDLDRPGAYQWWYFDATSDDGAYALVAIFFVGSVFSPWYAQRRAMGARALPGEHAAVNVALYDLRAPRGPRSVWAFNEVGSGDWEGDGARAVRVRRSRLEANARGYSLTLDEACGPLSRVRALRGHARFDRAGAPGVSAHVGAYAIDDEGAHRWIPAAPRCAVHVELDEPRLSFRGYGYHDVNHGDVPLEQSFSRWTWCRAHEPMGTRIAYDRVLRSGERRVLSVSASADVNAAAKSASRVSVSDMDLRAGAWALREPRALRVDGESLEGVRRVESSPFYARYAARTRGGHPAVAEHLDLERFDTLWMRALLPFRARRVRG